MQLNKWQTNKLDLWPQNLFVLTNGTLVQIVITLMIENLKGFNKGLIYIAKLNLYFVSIRLV